MTQSMRPSTLQTLGLGSAADIFRGARLPAEASDLVDRVFGKPGERGSLVISGANGIVGAGKMMQLTARLEPLGVTSVGRGLEGRTIAYHHGCHALRELRVHDEPLRLLEGAGARVVPWEAAEECCGFGGLFSVKLPVVSAGMADRKLDTLPAVDFLTSADGGCLMQLSTRAARRGLRLSFRHLASVLKEAAS